MTRPNVADEAIRRKPGVRVYGSAIRLRGAQSPRRYERDASDECTAPHPRAAELVAAHAARVAAEDPGPEPQGVCWGCGAVAAKRTHTGWPGRWVVLVPGRRPVREVQCPACYEAFGFIGGEGVA